MKDTVSVSAPSVLQEYYRILTAGSDAFGQGEELRGLLTSHLDFTGSLAGHHVDATEGFLRGMVDFISTVRSINVIGEVHDGQASAVFYDAEMLGGIVRFAEFFTIRDGVIDTLNHHYDGQDYITKGGQ